MVGLVEEIDAISIRASALLDVVATDYLVHLHRESTLCRETRLGQPHALFRFHNAKIWDPRRSKLSDVIHQMVVRNSWG